MIKKTDMILNSIILFHEMEDVDYFKSKSYSKTFSGQILEF